MNAARPTDMATGLYHAEQRAVIEARAEIERLKGERAQATDASLEARAWPQRGLTRAEFDKRLAFIVSDMSSEDAAWLRSRLASYAGWETDPGRWAAIAAIEGAAEGSGMRFARMRDLSEALVGLAVVRAVDASRPEVRAMRGALTAVGFPVQDGESLDKAFARAWEWCTEMVQKGRASKPERAFPRVALSTVAPGSLIEIASGDIGVLTSADTDRRLRSVLWITTGHVGTMPATSTVSLRATPAELDALTSADATEAQDEIVAALKALGARPDLTLGEAIARFKARRASRPGLTEEQARDEVRAVLGRFFAMTPTTIAAVNALVPILRASRGETGPAPTWGEQAIAEHRRAADLGPGIGPGIGGAPIRVRPTAAPDPLAPDPEDGTLCADCRAPRNTIHGALCSVRAGAKPGRVPDPRATLHAGDPASPFAPGSLAAGSATEDRILDRKRGGK